jgi:hypothetical protein
MTFHRYLGLKHGFGADPRLGEAADCLLLCFALLEDAGVPAPVVDPSWFEMARAGLWGSLETAWNRGTVSVEKPEKFAVSLYRNRPKPDHPRLGVSTVIESGGSLGIVMIHARKGVVWLPLSTPGLPKFQFRKFKQ